MPLHVDFQRVGKDGIIRVSIPVHFINEALSPGLKRGGVLNIVRHDIEVFCPYDKIPQFFEVSLEGLEIGRSIHISAVKLPEGVSPVIKNRDFTIATIAGALKGEEETTTAAATPEPRQQPRLQPMPKAQRLPPAPRHLQPRGKAQPPRKAAAAPPRQPHRLRSQPERSNSRPGAIFRLRRSLPEAGASGRALRPARRSARAIISRDPRLSRSAPEASRKAQAK